MNVSPREKMVEFVLELLRKAAKNTGDAIASSANRPKTRAYLYGRLTKEFSEHAGEHRLVIEEVIRRVNDEPGANIAFGRRTRPSAKGRESVDSPAWEPRIAQICTLFDWPIVHIELKTLAQRAFGWNDSFYADVVTAAEEREVLEYKHPFWLRCTPEMMEGKPRKMPRPERVQIIKTQRWLPSIVDCDERIDMETGIVSVIRLDNGFCIEQYPYATKTGVDAPKIPQPVLPDFAKGVPNLNGEEVTEEPAEEPRTLEQDDGAVEQEESKEASPPPAAVGASEPEFLARTGPPTTPKEAGFSADALAKISGCPRDTVSRYFKGERIRAKAAMAIEAAMQRDDVGPRKLGFNSRGEFRRREGKPTTAGELGYSCKAIASLSGSTNSTVARYFSGEAVAAETAAAIEKVIAERSHEVRAQGRHAGRAKDESSLNVPPDDAQKEIEALKKRLSELESKLK